MKMQDLDAGTSLQEQLADASSEPVVLINIFHVPGEEIETFLAALTDEAQFMKAQSGCLSAQLHHGIAGSNTFVNYAVWESVAAFRAAFTNPTFQAKLSRYSDTITTSPHLFRKVALSGVCAA